MIAIDLSPTLVIGAGLVGASVGCALTRAGVTVHVADKVSSHARVAASRGAGTIRKPDPDTTMSTTPGRSPICSRSSAGTTRRPALSMVAFMPLPYQPPTTSESSLRRANVGWQANEHLPL